MFTSLLREFTRVERDFIAAGNTRAALSFHASFPIIDGLPPSAPNYWAAARAKLTEVQNLLAKKQKQLNDAPEQDCGKREAKKEPPKDPQSPPDPLAGLTRPTPREITIPEVPAYFCSEAERRKWYLDYFASEWLEAAANVEDAASYRAAVSSRAAAHFIKDGDRAQ